MVADISPDLRREQYLRCEMDGNFGNGWARQLQKLERSGTPNAGVCMSISRHLDLAAAQNAVAATVQQSPPDASKSK
jgi:hypothetical protein